MNYMRLLTLFTALFVSIFCIRFVVQTLSPVLDNDTLASVFLSLVTLWFSAEMGSFALSSMISERRRKKIIQELDNERAFRKLGGD